jgi:hypothetical protein
MPASRAMLDLMQAYKISVNFGVVSKGLFSVIFGVVSKGLFSVNFGVVSKGLTTLIE